jgi:hypothetical protein
MSTILKIMETDKLMKAGDEIKCDYCGANSFLVKKTIMDGWTKKGDVLSCSACSKVIHEIAEEKKLTINEGKERLKKASLDNLTSFLGTEQQLKPIIDVKDDEKHFCRDCRHYISHPFLDRCSLRQVEVNPMDDCESFE